ncbi:MAG: aromatic ring-hydroxylating dioxygenase subunit alpha [Ilumatobacteraceae bacterium]
MAFSVAEPSALDRPDPSRRWSAKGLGRIPYWIYTDPDLYGMEQERIFRGPSWSYVGLTAEVPEPGDFLRTSIGDTPLIVTRDRRGQVHVVVNRCAHRGVVLCNAPFGNASTFTCPYHQWSYAGDGRLLGVPFRKGVGGNGGMPAEFDVADHGLERLAVTERNGVVFASFDHGLGPLDDYLGTTNLGWFDRVFDGRRLEVLGYQRQTVPANWKLMFENIKDPYHASLLHVFLVTFGLFRADNPSKTQMDPSGKHSVLVSQRSAQREVIGTDDISRVKHDLTLLDPRLLDPMREFPGAETVVMQTIWPNLIVQQQSNTLAMRQLVTRSVDRFELHWTYFGYADDDDAMRFRRLRQANLMGPAGLVSIDDSEVMRLAQQGAKAGIDREAVLEMGGTDTADTEHMVTEVALRAFYHHYREVMGL